MFVTIVTAGVTLASLRLTPVYESTATIDIDRRMPMGILGREASEYPASDSDQFLATQVSLIQSDSVVRPVLNALGAANRCHGAESGGGGAKQFG